MKGYQTFTQCYDHFWLLKMSKVEKIGNIYDD
jgi:hypothetical protein